MERLRFGRADYGGLVTVSTLILWAQDLIYPAFLAVARRFWPVPRLCRLVIVTRFDDVQEVLHRWQDFPVPYGAKAEKLGWHPPFLLGMPGDRGGLYTEQRREVEELWRRDDLSRVQGIAQRVTHDALRQQAQLELALEPARNRGESTEVPFDAMQNIIVASAIAIVKEYYGVEITQERDFALATYEVAGYLFGLRKPSQKVPQKTQDAIHLIFRSIDASLSANSAVGNSIIARARARNIPNAILRSWMMGMIVGFIPAHTNAAGRALHVLLDNDIARAEMKAAAIAGMDDALLTLSYEALRFRYILPGLWRQAKGTPTINEGTDRPFQFRDGDCVYVSPLSAMHDRDRVLRPHAFMPNRPNNLYLIYGYGMHNCIGRGIADTLLKENFRLLFKGGVARLRRTRWHGSIPERIEVVIGPRSDAY